MKTNNLKQFEKYYNGEMSPEEKLSFEESLQNDPELNAAFSEYLGIYEALGDKDMMDLRMILKEIREENAKKRKTNDFFSQGYNWIWAAALITVIISFTVIMSMYISKIERAAPQLASGTTNEKPHLGALDRELMRYEQRTSDFALFEPDNLIIKRNRKPLEFKWTITEPDSLVLDLIDWSGKIVFSSVHPVSSPYEIKSRLPAGVLLYRFRTETESYSLGFLYLK